MNLLVLFDVDGTLLLSHDEIYVEANSAALREVYGVTDVPHPDDPGDTALHYTRLVLERVGLDTKTIDEGLERWCAAISRRYVELLAHADTSPWNVARDAAQTLEGIQHRVLLTGNPERIARARMVRIGLSQYFAEGQGAFGCEREQRTALIHLALQRADEWPPERAVAVGDTPRDVHTAHEAGISCIGVTTGAYDEEQLSAADRVIGALRELPEALASL